MDLTKCSSCGSGLSRSSVKCSHCSLYFCTLTCQHENKADHYITCKGLHSSATSSSISSQSIPSLLTSSSSESPRNPKHPSYTFSQKGLKGSDRYY